MDTTFIRKGAVINGYTLKNGINDTPIDTKKAVSCVAKGHDWSAVRRNQVQIGITCARCHATAS